MSIAFSEGTSYAVTYPEVSQRSSRSRPRETRARCAVSRPGRAEALSKRRSEIAQQGAADRWSE